MQKLISTPIIVTLELSKPFEIMCYASGVELRVVLGQCHMKILHTIYYAFKALNTTKKIYTIIEYELLTVVFAFQKFKLYLLGTKVMVHKDHLTL